MSWNDTFGDHESVIREKQGRGLSFSAWHARLMLAEIDRLREEVGRLSMAHQAAAQELRQYRLRGPFPEAEIRAAGARSMQAKCIVAVSGRAKAIGADSAFAAMQDIIELKPEDV